jgi:NAD(P)-dependent dehydrogenase (short-subunit alcohol dehydrogenase family)
MPEAGDREVGLVTGAASGVGSKLVERLAARGLAVLATDINPEGLERTIAAAADSPGTVTAVTADIGNSEEVAKVIEAASELGQLKTVANVAGMAIRKSLEETTIDDWYRMIDINLTGVFVACQSGAAAMREHGEGGAIVNVSSVSGFVGMGYAAYCAAKGGVIGLTKMLATELGPAGIRVNSVAPGPIASAFTAEAREVPGVEGAIAGATSLGRFSQPDEIAAAVEFLTLPESSFITGEVLVVDGGMTAKVNLGSASGAYGKVDADA